MEKFIRSLAPSEKRFAVHEIYLGYSVSVCGHLDADILSTSYNIVHKIYPELGARLQWVDDDIIDIMEPANAVPNFFNFYGTHEKIFPADFILNQSEALSSLLVSPESGEGKTTVTLVTHHSIADAKRSIALLQKLWTVYTEIDHGNPLATQTLACSYPEPVENLLAARGVYKQMSTTPFHSSRLDTPGRTDTGALRSADKRQIVRDTARHRFTETATRMLRQVADREKVTTNFLVSAAIIRAKASFHGLPISQVAIGYSVDLRKKIIPPISSTEGTNVVGVNCFVPSLDCENDLVTLARNMRTELEERLRSRLIVETAFHLDSVLAEISHVYRLDSISNFGHIPQFRTPASLFFTDFRTGTSAKISEKTRDHSNGGFYITTFGERLSVEYHYFPNMEKEAVDTINLVTAELLEITGNA